MKRDYACLKAVILSSILLASIEYCTVLITDDYSSCFWHNTFMGSLISWIFRIILFTSVTIFIYQLLIPKYKTLKDRMIERDEENHKQRKVEGSLQLGSYGYETNWFLNLLLEQFKILLLPCATFRLKCEQSSLNSVDISILPLYFSALSFVHMSNEHLPR